MLYLKELNIEDSLKEYQFLTTIKTENGFYNAYESITYDTFIHQVIPERMDASKGMVKEISHVPDTYYFLWLDDIIIGLFKVRHHLNDILRIGAGHIGYAILKTHRSKGYAKEGLRLAIEKLKNIPSFEGDEIYLSCLKSNIPSFKTMLANGGYIHHEDTETYYVRIPVKK